MHPLVRDLCKRIILASRRHPKGEAYVKEAARASLRQNASLSDEDDMIRAVGRGRRAVRDAEEFAKFARYRALRKRYLSRSEP